MKIALTSVYGWPEVRRGGERYLHELSAALVRAGHEVQVLVSAPRSETRSVLGVTVRSLRRGGLIGRSVHGRYSGDMADSIELGIRSFARLGVRPLDVWHAVSPGDGYAASMAARLRPGLRSVYTELGFPSRASRSRSAGGGIYQRLVRSADHVVCLSDAATAMLATDYGRDGVTIGGGVDLTRFSPGVIESSGRAVLLVPGACDVSRKNVPAILEAIGSLSGGVEVDTWLVGPGSLPALSETAQRGMATVTRQQVADPADMPELYRQAAVTVLASSSEVFGLVALESLASGTPVVVLGDGLGPAQLVTAGTGVSARPDLSDLAASIARALDLASDPSTAERCRIRAADYDWDTKIVPRLEALYSD